MTSTSISRRLEIFIAEWKSLEDEGPFFVEGVIDGEVVMRTPAMSGKSAYFQELNRYQIEDDVGQITFYVNRKEKAKSCCIAKTTMTKQQILANTGIDQWLKMKTPTDLDDLVGQVRVDVSLSPNKTGKSWSANVTLLEGFGFRPEPLFARLSVDCVPSQFLTHRWERERADQQLIVKSKVSKQDDIQPLWFDQFTFEVPTLLKEENDALIWSHMRPAVLRISVWRQLDSGDPQFLGENCLPLCADHIASKRRSCTIKSLSTNDDDSQWVQLERSDIDDRHELENMGSLRVRVKLQEMFVLPEDSYSTLSTYLSDLLSETPSEWAFNAAMDDIPDKDMIARPLVSFHMHRGTVVEFLSVLSRAEIERESEPSTLFRRNSLATKSLDQFMKLIAYEYLVETLMPVLSDILRNKLNCEINPSMLSESDNLDTNLDRFCDHMERLLTAIISSQVLCPPDLRRVLNQVAYAARQQFEGHPHAALNAVSSFIFLRFFAPAVLNPRLFNLTNTRVSIETTRTLTLLSKTLQTLTNVGRDGEVKEAFMKPVLEKLKKYEKPLVTFLSAVSTAPASSVSGSVAPAHEEIVPFTGVIKEGFMVKRGQGRRKTLVGNLTINGRKNVKRRYFVLTSDGFSYHKSKDDDALYIIPINEILGAEPVDEDCLPFENPFQIIQSRGQPLYVGAPSPVLAGEWLFELRKLVESNSVRRSGYHPGIKSSVWSCCGQKSDDAPGCRRCNSATKQVAKRIFRERWTICEELESICLFIENHQGTFTSLVEKEAISQTVKQNTKLMFEALEAVKHQHQQLDPSAPVPGKSKYSPLTSQHLRGRSLSKISIPKP